MMPRPASVLSALLMVTLLAPAQPAAAQPTTLTLLTHDSFYLPDEVIEAFEAEHGVDLQVLPAGDAGAMVNQAILTADRPLADVLFGIDNTFLSRALAADIFEPYRSPALEAVPAELVLDAEHRVTPIDVADVCLNIDRAVFEAEGLPLPTALTDLLDPALAGRLVVENPATSSPGLAFLLTTIAVFGDPGYLDFWAALRANDVLVVDGWSAAYYTHFTVGSGGEGDRPLVVSYSTSPAADVFFSESAKTEPDSGSIAPPGQTFRQIEFVGILIGAKQRELAQKFVDFMLGTTFQEDIPLQMFVYPANNRAKLPDLFEQFAEQPKDSVEMNPNEIEANRERWIEAWTEVVLR